MGKGFVMEHAEMIKQGIQIRWMIRRDMPEVLNIDALEFAQQWSEEDFLLCLKKRNCIGMVIEVRDHVVGYMVYELEKDLLRIRRFAVASPFQMKGLGREMVLKLKGKLSQQRRHALTFEIRESNTSAQLFLRSMGFKAAYVNRGYFEDTDEDCYLFEYVLNECND